jgi:predicted phosphate transport protein (TIGR00153 family)
MPKQAKLFEQFERLAQLSVDASAELGKLLGDLANARTHLGPIEKLEAEGDEINHLAQKMLQTGVNAPLERSEVLELLEELDSLLDRIDATGHRIVTYRVKLVRPEAFALRDILEKSCREVVRMVSSLRVSRDAEGVLAHAVEVKRLENEGDQVMRQAIGTLFEHERDAIELIKWKELFEILESAIDSCEHVARVIERVVLGRR